MFLKQVSLLIFVCSEKATNENMLNVENKSLIVTKSMDLYADHSHTGSQSPCGAESVLYNRTTILS